MDWARGRNSSRASTLFIPATEAMTPDLPKLRRKLQKLPRRVSWFGGESQESDKKRKKANRATSMSAAQSYILPPAPEMGDGKWLDYVLQPLDSPRAQTWDVADLLPDPKKKPQAPVVPELSHLVVRKRVSNRRLGSSHSGSSRTSRGSRTSGASRRPGTPRATANSATIPARKPLPPSPTSSTETVGTSMRRHAKTPIFSIEQMERTNQIKAEAVAARRLERIASVEVIAEQYRALLDRSPSIYTQKSRKSLRPATPPPPMPERLDMGRRAVSEHVALQFRPKRPDTPLTPPGARSPTLSTKELARKEVPKPDSPKSRAFTLQSSHSKAPSFSGSSVSGSSSPTSVWSRRDSESGSDISVPSPTRASPAPGNLSLQICLDLLTRDLSSALTKNSRGDHDPCQRRPWRQESETSALQIWVMIEAYERLRDRLAAGEGAGAEMSPESKKAMEASLDMWLRSLYTIHDSLNGSHSPGASVRYSMSDYDEGEVRTVD